MSSAKFYTQVTTSTIKTEMSIASESSFRPFVVHPYYNHLLGPGNHWSLCDYKLGLYIIEFLKWNYIVHTLCAVFLFLE